MISLTPLQFLDRLQPVELLALVTSADPEVAVLRYLFGCADRIVSTDARLPTGKSLLVAKGILTQARADVVFNFQVPQISPPTQNP